MFLLLTIYARHPAARGWSSYSGKSHPPEESQSKTTRVSWCKLADVDAKWPEKQSGNGQYPFLNYLLESKLAKITNKEERLEGVLYYFLFFWREYFKIQGLLLSVIWNLGLTRSPLEIRSYLELLGRKSCSLCQSKWGVSAIFTLLRLFVLKFTASSKLRQQFQLGIGRNTWLSISTNLKTTKRSGGWGKTGKKEGKIIFFFKKKINQLVLFL